MFTYKLVAAAGTFDRFHKGHEAFLQKAFEVGKQVIIGLTTDKMIKQKKLAFLILPFAVRLAELTHFLQKRNYASRAFLVAIDDIYGPAAPGGKWERVKPIQRKPSRSDFPQWQDWASEAVSEIEALVVTRHTWENAQKINKRRQAAGLRPLDLIEVELVKDVEGRPIASHRIRSGSVDRQGRVFHSVKLALTPRVIGDEHRPRLRKPLGEFIKGEGKDLTQAAKQVIKKVSKKTPMIISVGDVATQSLLSLKFKLALAIVDLHVRRERVYQQLEEYNFPKEAKIRKVANPRGWVSKALLVAIRKAIRSYLKTSRLQVIEVTGEEDLAVLPAVLLAPLNSAVIYGQPPFGKGRIGIDHWQGAEGLVLVSVTEEKKLEVLQILKELPRG